MPRRPKPSIEPRVLSRSEVAAYLGRSLDWLAEHEDALAGMGFPTPLPLINGYDKNAVDAWLSSLSGLGTGTCLGS